MALDKVVDSTVLDAALTAIADAIREKGSTTELLTLEGMVDAIGAIETGSAGATDVTDSIISAAFSSTNSVSTYTKFDGIVPQNAKIAIFFWQGDQSNAANNQCLLAILQRVYINSSNIYAGVMTYFRYRNSTVEFQTNVNNSYDLIVNAGDTFRMVAVK